MNEHEDDQMTAEELATMFNEPVPEVKVDPFPEETIYAVNARIRNHAMVTVNSPAIIAGLCNSYTHVIKDFYDFANTLSESDCDRLKKLIRNHEGMPTNSIAHLHAGLIQIKSDVKLLKQKNHILFLDLSKTQEQLLEEQNRSIFSIILERLRNKFAPRKSRWKFQ